MFKYDYSVLIVLLIVVTQKLFFKKINKFVIFFCIFINFIFLTILLSLNFNTTGLFILIPLLFLVSSVELIATWLYFFFYSSKKTLTLF